MTILTKHSKTIYSGTGRRKTSIARVKLIPGSGKLIINGLPGESYLQFSPNYLRVSCAPLRTLGLSKEYDIHVRTEGGGLTGQANAIRLGLARALCRINPENRITLKSEGFLTRDARVKERKKYGLRKARKAPQYSKR
uniref:Small ribosomal subunit protein uS9c n=2 Tax=Gracilariopsis TaxID=2781 RepID=A0A345U9Q7_9FLOR|nr:ribosomal protein S9 [Gracilariopsis longissima]YP_010199455.1 ribosomal protein S9 [Gracilariopsis tenuifrons]AXF36199.1 ribosomal protein S17 [Gracilariopsis tenuifrons]AXI97193.1 ribosomal protein S9 [Gracilariopsis longissima]UAD89109.1 ribosomal protein S9 [Gracilariopsis longissima]UAD89313.1 ribosomal protein S9 [Gracilariopsis tenuifrons]